MKIKHIILIVILASVALGALVWFQHKSLVVSNQLQHHDLYYCPMHPQILYDHPGHCPICGMDLVKKVTEEKQERSQVEGYATITVTAPQQQMIGLRTAIVEVKPVVKSIRTFGTVDSALELYQIQNEFIDAYVAYVNVHRDYKRINDRSDAWGIHRDMQTRLLEAQDKLLKLGLSEDEIRRLQDVSWNEIRKQPKLMLFNDERRYWVMAQIYEQDLSLVKAGQEVEVNIPAYHETIKGNIVSVGGFIDPVSRSVTALIELSEYQGELAANMLVDVSIPVKLGNALLVPREAVMDTGLRKIVFVCKADDAFQPREIQTGWETDDGDQVVSGLKVGDRIVVSGNFLLDSESRVQAGLEQGADHE